MEVLLMSEITHCLCLSVVVLFLQGVHELYDSTVKGLETACVENIVSSLSGEDPRLLVPNHAQIDALTLTDVREAVSRLLIPANVEVCIPTLHLLTISLTHYLTTSLSHSPKLLHCCFLYPHFDSCHCRCPYVATPLSPPWKNLPSPTLAPFLRVPPPLPSLPTTCTLSRTPPPALWGAVVC